MKLISAAVIIVSLAGTFTAAAQPSIKLTNGDLFDWGKVTAKETKLTAKIEIKNAGTEKLILDKPTTSCGCTVAQPEKNELMPNESAMLTVTLDISGKSGEITKTVIIPSNDPANPQTTLTVKANVYSPLEVTPKMFVLNQLKIGKKSTIKIGLTNTAEHTITVSAGRSVNISVSMKKPVRIFPGKSAEIEAFVVPREKGTINVAIILTTDDKEMPVISVKGYCNTEN